jgi:hypothetical protein
MNRLPGYDVGTGRSEMAVFGIIGAAGLTVLAAAVVPAMRFAEQRDAIVAGLVEPCGDHGATGSQHATLTAETNATAQKTMRPAAWLPASVSRIGSPPG